MLERLERARSIELKDDTRINLVTDADLASEAVLLGVLGARCPGHAILAEESGPRGHGEYTWYVDPLDGTTNYAHGIPHFCVTLAVEGPTEHGRRLLAGVVFDPTRGELFSAACGEGAWLGARRLHVSAPASLEASVLCTGFPYDLHQRPAAPLALFNRLVVRARGLRRMGSAALELAWLAAGRFDGFFELGLKPWDTAAGALLIREAGGVISRIDGAAYEPRFGDVVAGPPSVFSALQSECTLGLAAVGWQPAP